MPTPRLIVLLAAVLPLGWMIRPSLSSAQTGVTIAARRLGTVVTPDARIELGSVVEGLQVPVALAFLPDGRALVAERRIGRLSLLDLAAGAITTVQGTPRVHADTAGGGGLLDVIVHPEFGSNRVIYLAYSEGSREASATVVDRAQLQGTRLVERERVFSARPALSSNDHYGGRLALRNGYLFITVGDRLHPPNAQDLGTHAGKIIRVHEDGTVPRDNPFLGRDALPEIWSLGHRNPQGLAFHPVTGELWEHEHGPRGGDEINRPLAGGNFGWPIITYGREYEGGPVGEGLIRRDGMEQPVYYYTPSIAPSGMAFYTGDAFPAWKGSLLLGAMGLRHLNRVILDGNRVVGEERLFRDRRWRVRLVCQGPDGLVYLGVDDGLLIRLRPEGPDLK